MSNGYKVDLSALDEVIKKLNQVADDMGGRTKTTAKYETYLPKGWLGTGFQEADDLHHAHSEVKSNIEGYIDALHRLIQQFGSDAGKARKNYDEQEQRTQKSVSSDGWH